MAKRDVLKYYKESVNQFTEMTSLLEDLQKSYEEGKISQENIENIQTQIEAMKDNCDRLGYVVYLLNQPTFSFKKLKDQGLKGYFEEKKLTKEYALKSQQETVDFIKECLKEVEENDK